jgi:3-oxoacyl-[acyl-carrier protein] reductase
MENSCAFDVEISAEDVAAFAKLSGDFNPLHVDGSYAAATEYGRPVVHGALLIGLVSRVLGMHIPGSDCLILAMRVRFPKPAFYPASVHVEGKLKTFDQRRSAGTVTVSIHDRGQQTEVLSGEVTFTVRRTGESATAGSPAQPPAHVHTAGKRILVTGGTGHLGRQLLGHLTPAYAVTSVSRGGQSDLPGVTPAALDLENGPALEEFLAASRPEDFFGVVHMATPPYGNGFVSDDLDVTRRHLWHAVEIPLQLARWARQEGSSVKRIVLLGSHAGGKHPEPRTGAYSLAKMNMENLVRLLAVDLGTVGATINIVCPSALDVHDTPATGASAVPTGRLTSVADIANVLTFLLSEDAAQINGASIAVDGGLP